MILKNEQMDLCINCMNIHYCFYYKNKKEPVLFCEEYALEYVFKDTAASLNDIKQLKRAEAMFLTGKNRDCFIRGRINEFIFSDWKHRHKCPS
ncbi:hypothetical protein [Desulfobacter sp.]|uniref:hypothetical protein n=1 Tax=Desulfobacter sp. TaxID=2294 RepID=UPI003D117FCC